MLVNKHTAAFFILSLLFITFFLMKETEANSFNFKSNGVFQNPQKVEIRGYNDDAMEPFISRDEEYLFFNNSNDPKINTNLHYAKKIDGSTFQYKGEANGVNTTALEGVVSMDKENNFYFTSSRSYNKTLSTIWKGVFQNGFISNLELMESISLKKPGWINMDVEINAEGNVLYISDAFFKGIIPFPKKSDLSIAIKEGGVFQRSKDSDDIFQHINTKDLEYAPSISSDGLELFFTLARKKTSWLPTLPFNIEFKILYATRKNISDPFNHPEPVNSIFGYAEAPSITYDGKTLYYHKKENNRFVIYKVDRQ